MRTIAKPRESAPKEPKTAYKKATTPEGRESQLTALAYDLAEEQIRSGTASAQVIAHFLKAGSRREDLERKRLEQENNLLKAKIETLESQQRTEELYLEALQAMRSYSGQAPVSVDDDEYFD